VTAKRKRALVVGNWKMNLGESSARSLAAQLLKTISFDRADVAIAPAFPCLRAVLDVVSGTALQVSAQNVHWADAGAFTGEVAASMLSEMGVRFVIVGHSERRILFGETDGNVSRKILAARSHGLTPIVCVGENEQQRDGRRTREVVVAQIREAFTDRTLESPDDIVIAYEPVWAIGTGRTPRPEEISDAHAAIRAALAERFGPAASALGILYGGSVTAANARSLLNAPDVDGALVGGASLEAASFAGIVAAAGHA
jgi:triosephosphate isomerase